MGIFAQDPKRQQEQQPGGESGLHMDLDERLCPTCRRVLHPWESTCPDDDAAGVDRSSLTRADLPPPPAHLLDDECAGQAASPPQDGILPP
ncbi:MAG: hypothetical protein WD080_03235 [Egibacteraceae bacterium]